MRIAKHLAIAASAAFALGLSVAPRLTAGQGYAVDADAPFRSGPQPTRKQVEAIKHMVEREILWRAEISGADTRKAKRDVEEGNRKLAEGKLIDAWRLYRDARISVENPDTPSLGAHATPNNPNVTGTNGLPK